MEQDETQEVQPEQMDTTDEIFEDTSSESQEPDWKAEALKYKAMADRYKKRVSKEEPEQPTVIQSPAPTLNDEVVDLRLDGYSKSEVEFIMRNGGRKTLEDSNSLAAIAIKAARDQRKAEEESSKVRTTSGGSAIERKYTPEQLRNMSSQDLEKLLPKD
jgi:hypothetical protein